MNIGIILSGGTGTRMKLSMPKQYIEVGNKPIIGYCLDTFQKSEAIDKIVVVCHKDWEKMLKDYAKKHEITKICTFAESGESRQGSILNGLIACKNFAKGKDVVVIHDAARPCVSEKMLKDLVDLGDYDGVMPVLPLKDTVYYSEDGKSISKLLNRDRIFAGQAPESFIFDKYFKINTSVTMQEISAIRGSSEIAFKYGLNIKMIDGDENNYKITTIADLDKFKNYILGESK